MKKITLPLLFLPLFCVAQKDYCKNLKEITTHGNVRLSSPELKNTTVFKELKPGGEVFLHVHFKSEMEIQNQPGVELEMEDGTTLKYASIKVYSNSTGMVHAGNSMTGGSTSYGYVVQTIIPVTEDKETLSSKRIRKIKLTSMAKTLTRKEADAVLEYVQCLVNNSSQ